MNQPVKSPITLKFVILDIAGMFFLGLGLAKQFGNFDFIPNPFGLENYGVIFMVIGFILMTLAVVHLMGSLNINKK